MFLQGVLGCFSVGGGGGGGGQFGGGGGGWLAGWFLFGLGFLWACKQLSGLGRLSLVALQRYLPSTVVRCIEQGFCKYFLSSFRSFCQPYVIYKNHLIRSVCGSIIGLSLWLLSLQGLES